VHGNRGSTRRSPAPHTELPPPVSIPGLRPGFGGTGSVPSGQTAITRAHRGILAEIDGLVSREPLSPCVGRDALAAEMGALLIRRYGLGVQTVPVLRGRGSPIPFDQFAKREAGAPFRRRVTSIRTEASVHGKSWGRKRLMVGASYLHSGRTPRREKSHRQIPEGLGLRMFRHGTRC
jgi:hypothetical protein